MTKTHNRADGAIYRRERSVFWCAPLRTIQRWVQAGVDMNNPAAVVRWYSAMSARAQLTLTESFVRRIHEEGKKLEGPGQEEKGVMNSGDPDTADFLAQYKVGDEKDNLAGIKREREFYLFRVQRSRSRQDRAGEAEALKHYGRLSDIVHDCEIRAARLGRDLGESFSAQDVQRLGLAISFWTLRSADVLIRQLTSNLLASPGIGAIDRETVRRVVEPLVLFERVLAPLVRATQVNAGVALPKCFVDAMREGATSTLEDGEALFNRLYSQNILRLDKTPTQPLG